MIFRGIIAILFTVIFVTITMKSLTYFWALVVAFVILLAANSFRKWARGPSRAELVKALKEAQSK